MRFLRIVGKKASDYRNFGGTLPGKFFQCGGCCRRAGISPDFSDRAQREDVLGSQAAAGQTGAMPGVQRNTTPRRAVLASEAVEHGQTTVKGGNSKIVVKGIVIVIIVNIILQLLFLLFDI